MRCPKCQYISFESSDRCRNCGYEFALAVDVKTLDLPIQTGDEPIGPLKDFTLSDLDAAPKDDPAAATPRSADDGASFDLPLFRDRAAGDAPLVTPGGAPRAPLAVRRSSPAAGRAAARAPIEEPQLDLDGPLLSAPSEQPPPVEAGTGVEPQISAAPVGSRIVAALVDGVILGALGLVILYLTLKICDLTFSSIGVIPAAPFASFLLLIAGGYFTLFVTANGQTIGKMATGVKVVPADVGTSRVSLGHAVVRAVAYLVSALPAGLGFLPALFGADRRAIHDRLAATRVVKA
jgi:uncharacterized RDD family membrane protein YckC